MFEEQSTGICLTLAICLSVLWFVACIDSGTDIGTVLGTFQYTAFDTANAVVDQGEILFGKKESGRLAGRWWFSKSGNGELAGTMRSDTIWVNLHPQFRDHNLILFGIMQGNMIRGQWTWIGLPGVMSEGTFEAIKQ